VDSCAQPDADGCQFYQGEVIGREFVGSDGDTPALLDFVEEPLDEIARLSPCENPG
jgi:hypothetical protein